jgi:hypothetical protein
MSSPWTFALAVRPDFVIGPHIVGEETVQTKSQAWRRRLISWIPVLFLSGCGGSFEVRELPEASKKALIRRKVDVEQRPVKSSKTGQGSPKGQPPSR